MENKTELTIFEAAIYSGKSIYTIRRYVKDGKVESKVGERNEFLIDKDSLDKYLAVKEEIRLKNEARKNRESRIEEIIKSWINEDGQIDGKEVAEGIIEILKNRRKVSE